MSPAKVANLGLRFALELCTLAALGYWGFRTGSGPLMKLVLGLGAPVVAATACMPSRNANASAGCILKTKGIIKARVAAPPMPGSKPTQKPSSMPTSIKLKAFHCKTRNKPSMKASNMIAC